MCKKIKPLLNFEHFILHSYSVQGRIKVCPKIWGLMPYQTTSLLSNTTKDTAPLDNLSNLSTVSPDNKNQEFLY